MPRRRLIAYLVALCALQTAHNLLPYVGLRDDSCQTMFCGLEWGAHWNNHHFMPQRMVGDLWAYHTDVEATLAPAPPPGSRAAHLARWLNQEDRALNTEATRAVIHQLCAGGYRVRLRYRDAIGRDLREAEDACREPALSEPAWWIPVRLFETDLPEELLRSHLRPEDLPSAALPSEGRP